jgi:hypothetical protein
VRAGHKAADAVRTGDFLPLAAAKELGLLSVSDQERTRQSIVFMADFNARGMGTSLGPLAILAMMGRSCHFRPIVEVPELPKICSTCGLATQLSVGGSRWQLARGCPRNLFRLFRIDLRFLEGCAAFGRRIRSDVGVRAGEVARTRSPRWYLPGGNFAGRRVGARADSAGYFFHGTRQLPRPARKSSARTR